MPDSVRHPIWRNAAGVIAGTYIAIAAGATPAAAHTALEDSSPRDGARIGAAPDEVRLDFTGPVRVRSSRVAVRGPAGERFELGPATGAADKIVQPLRPLGARGGYEVAYRVVAADGHVLTGVIRFALTRPGPAGDSGTEPSGASRGRPVRAAAGPVITGRIDLLPPWVFITTAIAAAVLVTGAAWYGRRATDDLV